MILIYNILNNYKLSSFARRVHLMSYLLRIYSVCYHHPLGYVIESPECFEQREISRTTYTVDCEGSDSENLSLLLAHYTSNRQNTGYITFIFS